MADKAKNKNTKPVSSQNGKAKKTNTKPAVKKKVKRKKGHAGKILAAFIIVVAIAAVVGFFYIKNSFYYQNHFYQGTFINGVDVSDMTVEEAKATVQKQLDTYVYSFTDHEGRTSVIAAAELGITYYDNGEIQNLMRSQNHWMWVDEQQRTEKFEVAAKYTFNEDILNAWVDALDCVNDGVAPTDAYEQVNEEGYYEIVDETYGDLIDKEMLRGIILEDVKSGVTEDSISAESAVFLRPSVTADDEELVASVEQKNHEIDYQKRVDEITNVTLSFASYIDIAYLDPTALKGMIKDDENGDPQIDKDKVTEWVVNWAAERQLINDGYLFLSHNGYVLRLTNGVTSGWHLDVAATAEKTYQHIIAGATGQQLFPVMSDGAGILQENSMYIEISIGQQMMWLYNNGAILVETPIVTGDPTRGLSTPSNGFWNVITKLTNYILRGPMQPDGSYEWETHVDYWMAFIPDTGIHDMKDRIEFGGDIFLGAGSHGCVNTPFDAAAYMYNVVNIGTPVVIHD